MSKTELERNIAPAKEVLLTSNAQVVSDTRVLEVQVAWSAFVPSGVFAPDGCEIQETVARLWHLCGGVKEIHGKRISITSHNKMWFRIFRGFNNDINALCLSYGYRLNIECFIYSLESCLIANPKWVNFLHEIYIYRWISVVFLPHWGAGRIRVDVALQRHLNALAQRITEAGRTGNGKGWCIWKRWIGKMCVFTIVY